MLFLDRLDDLDDLDHLFRSPPSTVRRLRLRLGLSSRLGLGLRARRFAPRLGTRSGRFTTRLAPRLTAWLRARLASWLRPRGLAARLRLPWLGARLLDARLATAAILDDHTIVAAVVAIQLGAWLVAPRRAHSTSQIFVGALVL